MQDALLVHIVQRRRSLAQPPDRLHRSGPPPQSQSVRHRAAGQILHDDERPALVLADVVDRDHIRVPGERRGEASLALESLDEPWLLGEVVREHLDCDPAHEHLNLRGPDRRHAAGPDVSHHLVSRRDRDDGTAGRRRDRFRRRRLTHVGDLPSASPSGNGLVGRSAAPRPPPRSRQDQRRARPAGQTEAVAGQHVTEEARERPAPRRGSERSARRDHLCCA